MNIETEQIRNHRLRAHHLDKKQPMTGLTAAAGACGLQNSPPGAWETALFNRLEGCTLEEVQKALYLEKSLVQAWSFRGAPVVFPTAQSAVFLTALRAQEGEEPWIYTRGITAALDFLQLPFEDLLKRTEKAAGCLDSCVIKSKEALDRTLAEIIERELPEEKRALWRAPSMYGNPDRQTAGGAAVSFLLRPCSFASLVVFGERQGISPTFTSFKNWIGGLPEHIPDAEKTLVRQFLHCYGPSTKEGLMAWLGCCPRQAERLWNTVADEMEPVVAGKKAASMLSADRESLLRPEKSRDRLILLGPHDPYLDIRDRWVLLEDKGLQKQVWKTVGNPGVVLKGGRIAGIWRTKTKKDKLELSIRLFERFQPGEKKAVEELAGEYADFRGLGLNSFCIE
ncbi:winged helix DNA-binding domain-containing protein [Eubacterium sp. 1001713B170207_170306_E7]|uniref:winged helix DNA-binding domain-containing protein n=1 Tax=Eubacterium sp. 1001713B170207_170306_E7 TaxID=2787097 RepID=UPI00189A4671|nr:winged helix DNA-binding domain-containing protein [Eubacterium sp. 1001713B170207_170306_E7]